MTHLFSLIIENMRPNKPIEHPPCLTRFALSVGTLKKAIKEEKQPTFDHIPADVLDLWQVRVHCLDSSIPTPELWQVDVLADDSALRNVSLDGVEPLPSVKRLSNPNVDFVTPDSGTIFFTRKAVG